MKSASRTVAVLTTAWLAVAASSGAQATQIGAGRAPAATADEPLRQTITVNGAEREYFIRLPKGFEATRTYPFVVAAHGAGGNGRTFFLASGIHRYADEQAFSVIVVSPTFSAEDGVAQQFPSLGEAAFLDAIVAEVAKRYRVPNKFLLAGYSRGGQFAHRYCQDSPSRVIACAPMAAGTWTTPDGRVIAQGVGELKNLDAARARTEDLVRDMTTPRVAPAAWKKAAPGASAIPYLVMTGTLDPRYSAGQLFAETLKKQGFTVETAWPVTNHTPDAATRPEYEKYAQEATRFFKQVLAAVK